MPRTDALYRRLDGNGGFDDDLNDNHLTLRDFARKLERAVAASERVYALLSKIKLTSEDVFTLNGLGQALADLEKALEECK